MSQSPYYPRILFCFTLLLLFACVLNPVSAEEVDIEDISITLYPDEIEPGDDFIIGILFEDPDDNADADILLQIEAEGVLIHNKTWRNIEFNEGDDLEINISSNDFDVYRGVGDIWNEGFMKYDCDDDIEIEVTVSDEVPDLTDSATLSIIPDDYDKRTLYMDIDPENPALDDDITVILEDGDGEVPDDGIRIQLTWIDDDTEDVWEDSDRTYNAGQTDNDGERVFNIFDDFIEEYGTYQIDAYRNDYCRVTETITLLQGELTVNGPNPSTPRVGDEFTIQVTDGDDPISGARAWINELGVSMTVTSDPDGFFHFIIDQEGSYNVFIDAGGYGEAEKRIQVASLSGMTITITPAPAEVNTPASIAVFSEGSALSGVSLTVNKPGSGTQSLTTGSDGKVAFTPSVTGLYTIDAVKDGFEDSSESFNVNSAFEIILPDVDEMVYGGMLTVIVKDADTNNPVLNADVSGTGVTPGTMTNSRGEFTVDLAKSGQYNFVVSKSTYSDKGFSVTVKCLLDLRLNTSSTYLGQPVGILVYDNEENDYVTGNIAIKKPDGTSDTKVASSHVLTPDQSGVYTLTLSKANCVGDEATLTIEERSLRLESQLEGTTLTVKTVSRGVPIAGVEVEVISPSGISETTFSDDDGMIIINAIEVGNYTVISIDDRFDEDTISVMREESFLSAYWWLILLIVLLLLFIVLIGLVVAVLMRAKKGSRGGSSGGSGGTSSKRPSTGSYSGRGTSLG